MSQVNVAGANILEFISDFGKPIAPLPAAIVACVPKKVHIDGVGETEFKIYPHEISNAIKAGLEEPIHAEPEVRYLMNFMYNSPMILVFPLFHLTIRLLAFYMLFISVLVSFFVS